MLVDSICMTELLDWGIFIYVFFFFLKRSSKAGAMFAPSILLLTLLSYPISYGELGVSYFFGFMFFFFLVITCKPLLLGLIHLICICIHGNGIGMRAACSKSDVVDLWMVVELYARMIKKMKQ